MKRLLKILLGLIGAIVLLLVLAAVLLPIIYDKEDLKKAIAGEVFEQTGRELRIDGNLDFSVFPWVAVEVSDLSLGNAEGFGDQPQAQIGMARVGVALMPLLQKQISVDEITLSGLKLSLVVNEKGQNNWDDLNSAKSSEGAKEPGPGMFSSKRVAGLNIRDAQIEYTDRKTGAHYRMGGFSLATGALGEGKAVPLEMATLLEDVTAGTKANVELAATAAIDLQAEQYTLDDFELLLALDTAGQTQTVRILAPQLSMNLAAQTLQLETFVLELDQSRFTGELNVSNFDRPKVGFKLATDQFDVDRYMAPASSEAASSTDDVAMPQETLQGKDVQGQVSVSLLRMAGLEFNNAEVGITIAGGKLRLHPLTAGFYGGTYSGDIALDGSGAVPQVALNEKIDSISFQQLVADLVDTESLSGTALGHARLAGRGKTSNEVLESLQGDLGLTLTEGALEGINIWYEIRRGMALYKRLPPPEPEPNRTVFSRMKVAGTVNDGIVSTSELTGELPFLTVSGDGTVDLGQSQVNLGMVAVVRNSPELAKDPLGSGLSGKKLPFKITGPLDAPSLSVDWEALLTSEATDILLDKLGVGKKKPSEDGAEGEQKDASSEDQLQETAKGALFDLLRKKDKNKDEGEEK